jgi:NAD+ diphosphatase
MVSAPRRGNFYSGVGLDRADHRRRDPAWLADRLSDPGTRFVPVWRARNLVAHGEDARAVWLTGQQTGALAAAATEAIFLGCNGVTAYFALDIPDIEEPGAEPALAELGHFRDLRAIGPLLGRREGAILAYARGLVHWHRRHRFCGLCGAPTERSAGGHVRRCRDSDCGADHFPRTDPAVIMLVHDGDRCVLGRQRAWPDGMHSRHGCRPIWGGRCRRSAGSTTCTVWGSACSVRGRSTRARHAPLRVNPDELAAAGWYTRAELRASPEDESFRLPRRDSIARRLIEDWLADA